jgi:hypothetical protein
MNEFTIYFKAATRSLGGGHEVVIRLRAGVTRLGQINFLHLVKGYLRSAQYGNGSCQNSSVQGVRFGSVEDALDKCMEPVQVRR